MSGAARMEVLMPRISEEVEEGIVVTWFVRPRTAVEEGTLLAEVQVEKVSEEVRAPAPGVVASLLVEPGGVVAQGAPIAVLETAAEAAPSPARPEPAVEAAAPAGAARPAGPAAGPGPVASPAARRLARELGVELAGLAGSGPGGRIVEADVRRAADGAAAAAVAGRVEPLSPMRKAIAERLHGWLAQTAQLTLTAEADVTDLVAELDRRSAKRERRASLTEAAVRAAALALRDHPRLAMRWTDAGLAAPESIDIGVAVALDDGLVAPVVRAADTKGLERLGREIAELAERARAGRLAQADSEGGVFTVTNLGRYRIDAFTPLLNPPQTAVLGLGRARPRPAVVGSQVMPRTLLVLSLTFDHRVLDGAPAAAFLDRVVALLEEPAALLDV